MQGTVSVYSLEEILSKPHLLVGQRIRHRFRVEHSTESSKLVWYDGTVQKMNPDTLNFLVQYDGENGAHTYPLLDDINNGDLLLA